MLALQLGYSNPFAMAEELPARVFLMWQEFFQENPFGPWRDNFNAAQICALLVNRNLSKNEKPVNVQQFMYESPSSRKNRLKTEQENKTKGFIQSLIARAKPKND